MSVRWMTSIQPSHHPTKKDPFAGAPGNKTKTGYPDLWAGLGALPADPRFIDSHPSAMRLRKDGHLARGT